MPHKGACREKFFEDLFGVGTDEELVLKRFRAGFVFIPIGGGWISYCKKDCSYRAMPVSPFLSAYLDPERYHFVGMRFENASYLVSQLKDEQKMSADGSRRSVGALELLAVAYIETRKSGMYSSVQESFEGIMKRLHRLLADTVIPAEIMKEVVFE